MITTLLLPALLLGSGPASEASPPPTLLVRAAVDGYAELAAEYDAAVARWQTEIENAEDKSARNELRRNHPAKDFYPRFEALGERGEGQALLWMATHLREKGLRASERGPIATELYGKLFASHLEAPWFGDVIQAMTSDTKVEASDRQRMLEAAVEGAKAPSTKAPAMFALGAMLMEGEAADKKRGEELLRAVAKDYAKTSWGTMAQAMFITAEDLQPGKPAPDFYGESIDGFGFNLSDYRGKVVLLDFYGFW